jgi:uncharacterized SAM-binding protein YcdF (DUF218 family)
MSRFGDPERNLTRQRLSAFGWLLGGLASLYLIFFIVFVETLSSAHQNVPEADAIVVFTGTAPSRLEVGLDLLRRDKGKRLLITGLYERQSFDEILALAPRHAKARVKCCLDLDYRAANTLANARETALWAEVHGFKSLIVVTSAQHMPRAFLELRRAMPTARLSAYGVVPPRVKLDYWFAYPGTMALLLGEYSRYLWALTGLPRND